MFGLIGKMRAAPGKRDDLISIVLEGTVSMPGCLNYVVARDPADADGVWITEVWTDEASHKAALGLPEVQAAIAKSTANHRWFRQPDAHGTGGRRRFLNQRPGHSRQCRRNEHGNHVHLVPYKRHAGGKGDCCGSKVKG